MRGTASNYIKPIDDVQPGDKVVLCCRVSTYEQGRTEKLTRQVAYLRQEMERREAAVVYVIRHVGSGRNPYWLAKAVVIAKEHGAKLVAESTSRFIRHPGYHSVQNWTAQARDVDLEDLRWWTKGMTLVTLLNPDASPADERSYQSKRGQRAKGRKGGRPKQNEAGYKKQRRISNLPKVYWMNVCGLSIRRIATMLQVPTMTVHGWIQRLR